MLHSLKCIKSFSFRNIYTSVNLFRSNVKIIQLEEDKWEIPVGHNTGIMLYNEITKENVPFVTKNKNEVYWYMCGPTVYNSAHIGHACSFLRCDIIRRVMESYFNLKVIQVMSITDIDDKIINRAANLNIDYKMLTKQCETEFFSDLNSLNIRFPTFAAKVTVFIPVITKFIQHLLNKKYAYESSDGSIYFDSNKFKRYGKLRPIILNEDNYDDEIFSIKRSILDFVLWKRAKVGEPFWESCIGPGRPGWHSECSAIATHFFGNNVDVHSGGVDLIHPHHESEEAQCCAYYDSKQWINYWIHTGHLHLKGDVKMSKSLGNTIKISDFLEKYTHNQFRMFCLLSNYADYVEFSEESMQIAIVHCNKFRNFFGNCLNYINGTVTEDKGNLDESRCLKLLQETELSIKRHLENDFNTYKSITELLHVVNEISQMMEQSFTDQPVISRNVGTMLAIYDFVKNTLQNFGFIFEDSDKIVGSEKQELKSLIDTAVSFRHDIRELAVNSLKLKNEENKKLAESLLKNCDNFREEMKLHKINIQDRGKLSSWSFLEKTANSDE